MAVQNSPLGLAGALLAIAGVASSAYLSRFRPTVAVPVGLALGAFAARAWWLAASRAAVADELTASLVGADASIIMAQRMCALVVGISFWMVRPAVVGFVLVPGLTVFGLASGRLEDLTVASVFCGFIGLAMVVLAWGMLAPEETSGVGRMEGAPFSLPGRSWRPRHLLTVGTVFVISLVLGYGLSLPIVAVSAAYRWPLIISLTPQGSERQSFAMPPGAGVDRFPVGTGPQPLSDAPVLAVFGEPAQHWRGAVYDQFTGSAWQRRQSEVTVPVRDHTADLSRSFPLPPGAHLRSHQVQVQMDQPFLIHSPGLIQRAILSLPGPTSYALQGDPFGGLALPGAMLTPGDSYQVISAALAEEGPGDLLAGSEPGRQPSAENGTASAPAASSLTPMLRVYRLVPFTARRVSELAKRVAGAKPTPEEKLDALVRYLQQNYVYSLDAPAVPRGEDAADYFLFHLKRGRCDLFATALTLMARAVDIPTRLVTGFLEGEYDEKTGAYLLRESDRHAWVEAYLPSSGGWVAVDPTPGVGEPATGGPKGWYLAWLRVRFFWQDHPAAAAGMVLALAAVLVLAFMAIRRRRYAWAGAPAQGHDARARVVRAYWQFLSLLRRRGMPRRASQTPLEFLGSLGGDSTLAQSLPGAALAPAAAITDIFVTVRYGPGPATEEQAATAKAALADLRAALRGRT